MAPFKKWGQRKIQICRFRQAENERERERGRGGKEERAGLWEETRVCRQGLRLSVCWGLSSEVDDALGEQLRCRAFRLHHYCSPSSSSSNDARTHTRTRPVQHTQKHVRGTHKHATAKKKKRNQWLLHQRSCFCAPLIRFCMPGRAEKSDKIRVSHGNGQPCCLHGCIKAFMETVGWEIVKKEKKTLKPAWWLIFNALLHVGRIWWKRAETEADEIGGGGRLTYWAKWHRWSPRATAPTVFTLIWVKWISHCRLCLNASRGCLNAAWQSIKPWTLIRISSETGRCYFHRPYLAPRRICTRRAASAE